MIGASCGEALLAQTRRSIIDRPRPGQWGVRAHLNGASSPSRAPRGCSRSPWTRVPALWGRAPRARHLIPESFGFSVKLPFGDGDRIEIDAHFIFLATVTSHAVS